MILSIINFKHQTPILNSIIFIFLFTALLCLNSSCVKAEDIIPKPKNYQAKGYWITLDNKWVIVTDTSSTDSLFVATLLKEHLRENLSLDICIMNEANMPTNNRILLLSPSLNGSLKAHIEKRSMPLPATLPKQGYAINMFADQQNEIIVCSSSPEGLFYGIQTLIQVIKGSSVKAIAVFDSPDHMIRGVDMALSPSMKINDTYPQFTFRHKTTIDHLASLKINMITQLTNNHFFNNSPTYIAAYKEMAEYCKKRHIEYVPNIGSLRTFSWVPFDLAEGWWIKDEPFIFNDKGLAVPLKPPSDLLHNLDYSIDKGVKLSSLGWKTTGTVEIDNAVRYKGHSSIKISNGGLTLELPVEPNSHYQLIAYGIGARPALVLRALFGVLGANNYKTYDYSESGRQQWFKFGVILKAGDNVSRIRVELSSLKGVSWMSGIKLFRIDGSLKNIIRCKTTDIKIFNPDNKQQYVNGIDYEILNGETNKLYDEDLRPFTIRALPNGNISRNQKVLVDYDAVLYWSRIHSANQPPCISDDRIYKEYYYPAIDRVMDNLKPKIIHFASDEIRGFNRDSRSRKRGLTNAQLYAEWLNKINAYVKAKDPGCRVLVWHDMISPYSAGGKDTSQLSFGGTLGRMAEATEKDMISKDVIIAIWYYNNKYLYEMTDTINYYNSKGYYFLGSPWYDRDNITTWSKLLIGKKGSLGGMDTDWGHSNVLYKQDSHFPIYADIFWNSRY